MKKLFAILSVVAVLFSSCENGGDNVPQKPNFPELQQFEAEAGGSYELTFTAEKAWSVTLPAASQSFAYLTYEGVTESSHSGTAGEHTITVNVRETAISYAKDILISVDMTMVGFTETIANYTIARTEIPVNVIGAPNAGSEGVVKSVFGQGGHPEDGPFVSAPHKYSLRHYSGSDAKYAEFYVEHDLDESSYNYVVYVKNEEGNFVAVSATPDSEGKLESWVEFVSFGRKHEKFRLYMNYSKGIKTPEVGYEAYVNLEDEYGDAVVSVYHVYNPDEEIVVNTSLELANAELAAEKGITIIGSGLSYTLTFPTEESFAKDYKAAALKFTGYTEIYGGFGSGTQNLVFSHDEATDSYYVHLAEEATTATLPRTEILNISAIGSGMDSYVVNLVFDWVPDNTAEIPDEYSAEFANSEGATALGATLEQLDPTSADFDAEWKVDLQYRLTYKSRALFNDPASLALNIPGLQFGAVSNIHNSSNEGSYSYSDALEFARDSQTGFAILRVKEGVDSSAIPNGSCALICSNANGTTFMRILFVLDAEPISDVTFNVAIAPQLEQKVNIPAVTSVTRAISDATKATRLQYAVYDEYGNLISNRMDTNTVINISADVTLSLTVGNRYSVIFWASAPDAPYTVDFESKSVSVDYTNVLCNDDSRDAFYAYHEFTAAESAMIMVSLRRPFAQINVGVAEGISGVENITKSMIKTTAQSKLDLVSGEATEPVEVEFGYAQIPAAEQFPVNGYKYVAMTYVLANTGSSYPEVTYGYTDGTNPVTATMPAVFVRRNMQTNLYVE